MHAFERTETLAIRLHITSLLGYRSTERDDCMRRSEIGSDGNRLEIRQIIYLSMSYRYYTGVLFSFQIEPENHQ